MLNRFHKSVISTVFLASLVIASCGAPQQTQDDSTLEFVRSTDKSAYLEKRDVQDTFLFGVNVIGVKDFASGALNLNIRPIEARLIFQKSEEGTKVFVINAHELSQKGLLFVFDAKEAPGGKVEVDFGSAGNEIELFNSVGGMFTSRDPKAEPWKTAGKPVVTNIYQDADTVVADVAHTVSMKVARPLLGAQERRGVVKIRIYLKRQTETASSSAITVSQAKIQNIGFFGSSRSEKNEGSQPISRFKVDTRSKARGQIVVYLKDFPAEYAPVARRAILAWNKAFGFDAIRVTDAPSEVDIGDPRFHVVKWFDGLDQEVPWAGYAPTNTNPVSGHVLNAQVLVNGSTTIKSFEDLASYTERAAPALKQLSGRIGRIPVVQGAGETPIVTFMTDPKMTKTEFLHGYYHSVIMHEFGHALGLRHNFAASTELDADVSLPASVMDYEPNWSSGRRVAPGSYDVSAIRFGYFGEKPTKKHAFCTDEDMESRVDCNQGDFGEPASYVHAALVTGHALLTRTSIALPSDTAMPMRGVMALAMKFQKHVSQFGDRSAQVAGKLKDALEAIRTAVPHADVPAEHHPVVTKNIARMKASLESATKAASAPEAVVASFE